MNTVQPITYRGDAKRAGESDDQHAKRVAYNAKQRLYHATFRQKRLAAEAKNDAARAAGVPLRGFAFVDENGGAAEVLPLPPPINVASAAPPVPPATVVESLVPKYQKRIEELEAVLRIKDMVLAYHIKEIATKDFIIRRLEECLRMREAV